tara:strand:- start:85 stop:435 length:351 start_codon:yes stop_codon:yes gene_type:complete
MRQILLIFSFVLIGCHNNDESSLKQLRKPSLSEDLTGSQFYMKHCAICHQKDAKGIIGFFPLIKDSDYFLEDLKRAIHNILFGQSETIVVNREKYKTMMPPVKISDKEVEMWSITF